MQCAHHAEQEAHLSLSDASPHSDVTVLTYKGASCLAAQSVASPARFSASMAEPLRAPVPPFTLETATKKVKAAENAWNTCDPTKVSMAYSPG